MAAQQITLRQHPYLSYAYLIEEGESVQSIPGYEEGLFTVQDVSSMLVTEAAGLLGDELLLDVCAAPGGKSLHAAGLLKRRSNVSRILPTVGPLIRRKQQKMQLPEYPDRDL